MNNQDKAQFLWEQGMNTRNTSRIILYKKFETTMEDLQDNPTLLKKEIMEYLTEHSSHIERIEIEPHVDENTFKPSIVLRLHTNISMVDSITSKLE